MLLISSQAWEEAKRLINVAIWDPYRGHAGFNRAFGICKQPHIRFLMLSKGLAATVGQPSL